MAIIPINHTRYYYEIHGQGHPVILISGYACDHTVWFPFLEYFKAHFQVLIFDNRGIGQTQDDGKILTSELMAKEIMALAKELKFDKPHIIGHSMGGTIAQCIANSHPRDISRLILCCTSCKWRQAMLLGFKALVLMREKGATWDDVFEAMLPWIFGEKFLLNREKVRNLKQMMLENPYHQSLEDQKRQLHVLMHYEAKQILRSIQAPTLILYGKEDIVTLPEEAKELASKIPNSFLRECPSAHGALLEIPDKLNSYCVQFLKKGDLF